MGKLTYLKNVVSLKLTVDRCTGCGMCTQVCPHGVFALVGKRTTIVDRDACMECGACARNCAAGAIFVRAVGCGCASNFIHGKKHGVVTRCFFRVWGYRV